MLKRMEEFHGFTILQFCGRGGFGEVYLVQDITGRKLALKVISRQRNPENFEQEFSGLCNYRRVIENHPHLLQIFHVAQDDSCLYYSMEAADSLEADSYRPFTLQNRIADGGYLSVADTDRLARGIREALEVLHAHGMAHRDVKPGNILYVNGVPKLGDIGLVSSHDTVAGRVGTPGFLPPGLRSRFLEGSLTLEESQYCDFYALGKVIYCAFTGLPPDAYPELPSSLPLEEDQAEYARLNRLVREYCRYMPPPPDNRWTGAVRNFIDEIRRLAAWIGFRRRFSRAADSRDGCRLNRLLDESCRLLKLFLVVAVATSAFWIAEYSDRENELYRQQALAAVAEHEQLQKQFQHFSASTRHQVELLSENARELLREQERCRLIADNPALTREQRLPYLLRLRGYSAARTKWRAVNAAESSAEPSGILPRELPKMKRVYRWYPSSYAPLANHLQEENFRGVRSWEAPFYFPDSMRYSNLHGLIITGAIPFLSPPAIRLPNSFELILGWLRFPAPGTVLTLSFWNFDLQKGMPMANRFWEVTLRCRRDPESDRSSLGVEELRVNTNTLAEIGVGRKVWREIPCAVEEASEGSVLRIGLVKNKLNIFLDQRKLGECELGQEFAGVPDWRFGFSIYGEDMPVFVLDRMDIYGVSPL